MMSEMRRRFVASYHGCRIFYDGASVASTASFVLVFKNLMHASGKFNTVFFSLVNVFMKITVIFCP
jgi:hypothetical protein